MSKRTGVLNRDFAALIVAKMIASSGCYPNILDVER